MLERLLIILFSLIGMGLTFRWACRNPGRKGLVVPVWIGLVFYTLFYSLAVMRAANIWDVGIPLLNALSRIKDLYTVFIIVGILWYER